MKIVFSEAAKIEFEEAINYYNEKSPELGTRFENEVKKTISRILSFVDSYPKFSANTRRALTDRFPYGIIYSYTQDEIIVIAVMHLHRKPGYWKSRISGK